MDRPAFTDAIWNRPPEGVSHMSDAAELFGVYNITVRDFGDCFALYLLYLFAVHQIVDISLFWAY